MGLKWSDGNGDDVVIGRLMRVRDPDEIVDWVSTIKQKVPSLSVFMDFVAFTGVRFVEAVNSYNLIISLDRSRSLSQYYNCDRELLEHYRFKDLFMRRSKKLFISFASQTLIDVVRNCTPLSENAIQKRIRKARVRLRFGDLREYWAIVMTRTLCQP